MDHEKVFAQLKSFGRNRPAIILQIGEVLKQIMQAIKNGMVIYVFTYYLGLEGLLFWQPMFAFTVALMAGVFFMKPLIRMFRDTGRAYQFCMMAGAGTSVLLYILCRIYGPGAAADSMQFGVLFILFIVNGIFSGAYYSFSNVNAIPATVVFLFMGWSVKKWQGPGRHYIRNQRILHHDRRGAWSADYGHPFG
ncbi:MAG: MFS transporter [[Clostridium] scindens]